MKELAKQYDPSQVEDRIYQFWLDGGYSPCLRTKILVIRRALLTKTTSIYSSGRIL